MVDARRLWPMVGLLVAWAGCGDQVPPLDDLPLRDALRASPEVVAALSDGAGARLAARLEAARSADVSADPTTGTADPRLDVTALDEARAERQADALVVGTIAGGVGRALSADGPPGAASLPPLEGDVAGGTAAREASALAGTAAPSLRGLLAASGAHRLERVVGWPVGAVAMGETVYVNAAWLVSLASAGGGLDAGVSDGQAGGRGIGPPRSTTAPSTAVSGALDATTTTAADGACPPDAGDGQAVDAGTFPAMTRPASLSQSSSSDGGVGGGGGGTSFWDACGAGADGCSDSDSCDDSGDGYGQDNSCSGSNDGSGYDSGSGCASTPDDGSGCRMAPGRERPCDTTLIWVLAPLGFLVGRRR